MPDFFPEATRALLAEQLTERPIEFPSREPATSWAARAQVHSFASRLGLVQASVTLALVSTNYSIVYLGLGFIFVPSSASPVILTPGVGRG